MAFKKQQGTQSNKRKTIPASTKSGDVKFSPKKKLKTSTNSQPINKGFKKPFSSSNKLEHSKPFGKPKFDKSDSAQNVPKTKRELRIQSKELAEAKKKNPEDLITHLRKCIHSST